MKPNERQLKITDIIRREGHVTVDELAATFKSSPETIRRDLSILALTGKVQKIHGGAKSSTLQGEGAFQQRMSQNVAAKRTIAESASKLISSGDTLLINAGSSTVIFAEELTKISNLTIVTSSLDIAKIMGANKNGTKVFLLGGEYSRDNQQTLGVSAISQLKQYHVQHVILPIGCINASVGFTDYDASDVALAQAMISHAENSIVLADSSKFNHTAPFVLGELDQIDRLVTEALPDNALLNALQESGVELICS